ILLGNYARDPDRFEAIDTLFQEFLREAGITPGHDPAHTEAIQTHTALLEAVQTIRTDIANLEEQLENTRKRLDPREDFISKLLNRIELHEILYHILASYEIRPIAGDYCPPVHLQQLRKALVSKEELKQVEQVIKQVPARKLSLKAIEELSKKIRRYSREEMQA